MRRSSATRPTADEQGNIVVVENGRVLARLKPLELFDAR
jgi:hypothetical protein